MADRTDSPNPATWLLCLIGMLGAMLAGCAVGPNYRRPASASPPAFAHAAAVITSNGVFNASWWETFHDPLLNRLILRASTNNFELRRAQARLREARALWTEARFDYVPTVRGEASYQN